MSGLIVPVKGFTPKVASSVFIAPAGNLAQKLRDLTEKDYESFRRIVAGYVELAKSHK